MAETPESQATPSSDNIHWGIAYLREDLQDLRSQMREDTKELRLQIVETNKRIDEVNRSLGQHIDETNKLLESRFIWIITTMVALTGVLIAVMKL